LGEAPQGQIFVRKETVNCVVAKAAAVQHAALELVGCRHVALQAKLMHFAREKVVARELHTALTHLALVGHVIAVACIFVVLG
jgi:hypothetical protein